MIRVLPLNCPTDWTEASLAQACEVVKAGGTPSRKVPPYWEPGDVPFAKVEDIVAASKYLTSVKERVSQDGIDNSSAWVVDQGDLLYTMYASFGVPAISRIRLATNQAILALRPRPELLNTEFLYYFLLAAKPFLDRVTRGTTQKNLSARIVREFCVPLPPLEEQRRIVARIEELLSQVGAGEVAADNARLLNASLTLAAVSALMPTGAGGDLPKGWRWIPLCDVGEMGRGRSRHRPRNDPSLYGGSHPFIQTGDVKAAQPYVRRATQSYNDKGLAQSRMWPPGTVCITIAANIAETAVLDIDACFPDSVVGVICDPEVCEAEYLEFFIRTVKSNLDRFAPATAQKNINLAILNNVRVPIPPMAEQRAILDGLQRIANTANGLSRDLTTVAGAGQALRSSILSAAFKGGL